MTGVGAGAAATGLTTGIVGSSVGMAAAFGAIGARSVGDRMSRRLGEPCSSVQVRNVLRRAATADQHSCLTERGYPYRRQEAFPINPVCVSGSDDSKHLRPYTD